MMMMKTMFPITMINNSNDDSSSSSSSRTTTTRRQRRATGRRSRSDFQMMLLTRPMIITSMMVILLISSSSSTNRSIGTWETNTAGQAAAVSPLPSPFLFLVGCDAFTTTTVVTSSRQQSATYRRSRKLLGPLYVASDIDRVVKSASSSSSSQDTTTSDLDNLTDQQRQLLLRNRMMNSTPRTLRVEGRGIPSRKERVQLLDASTYESMLLKKWEHDPALYKRGFDWEIEKLRRYFGGLRLRDDGNWVQKPTFFDFLITSTAETMWPIDGRPKPVGILDVIKLVVIQCLTNIGFGSALGMVAVPNAVIQKYEGSFFSFIKGVLGGDLQTLAGGPLFLLLAKYYHTYGPIFNLSFGPKSFLVISDPVMARHVLRESKPEQYCKGMLAEILSPIMGKGLIPADPATWKVRRRAIVPGFHKRWLNNMITMFGDRATILSNDLKNKGNTVVIDMEERFCSVTLDIIGKAVFNYDFGSVTKESPVVKAVYRVLREAEHRSSSFIPYWNLPYADQWMGGQVEFRKDMTMLDDILANLINQAILTRREATVEELEERDNQDDPSLLRFLVDMRGEDLSSMVLRDDLMTMLIAGHETTAAMLTWTLYELCRGPPGLLQEIQDEVRTVLHNKERPDLDDIYAMKKLRYALIESLRLYPEPPVLIRRARTDDNLPAGSARLPNTPTGQSYVDEIKVLRGTDMFISTWNLHRSPLLWEDPETFDPTRWERKFSNDDVSGWDGYDPERMSGLYPNEQASDFAFLPFGGGQRKCVGDQFAMMEAVVTMSMIINKFDFTFAIHPDRVGMKTGATIHTMNGLLMNVKEVIPSTTTTTTKDGETITISTTTNGSSSSSSSSSSEPGYWAMQHLKRGLDANGRPFGHVDKKKNKDNISAASLSSLNGGTTTTTTTSGAATTTTTTTKVNGSGGGCPMHLQ